MTFMNEVLTRIFDTGIIPVVKIEEVEKAVPMAKALVEGGISCVEITFRTAQAEQAIKRIADALPNMLVGAGTILTIEQVDKAVLAGAKFIVTPGFNPEVVKYCINRQIPITPGCSNPTDIEMAISFGLSVVKFFPAEAMGGVKVIKAISAPYSGIRFIPTGGISEKNLNDYLSCANVLACGGSWMVSEAFIKAGEFEKITNLTRNAVNTMLGFELDHIGMNNETNEQSTQTVKLFSSIFGFEYKKENSPIFADNEPEGTNETLRSKNGHIAISTNYISRAVKYFQSLGYEMDIAQAKTGSNGELKDVDFVQEFSGYAIHLIQKERK